MAATEKGELASEETAGWFEPALKGPFILLLEDGTEVDGSPIGTHHTYADGRVLKVVAHRKKES